MSLNPWFTKRPLPVGEGVLVQQMVELKELVAIHVTGTDKHYYLDMINGLDGDNWEDLGSSMAVLLGMRRAPAARGNHHSFEGGLVYHLLEMWEIWETWRKTFPLETREYVNNDRVLRGILNHDIHKAYRYYRLKSIEPWEVEPAFDHTDEMVIENVKSIQILNRYNITLDDQQMNALLWSEGGFSKTRPKWTSVLAKLLYLIDEMSGNVLGRIDKGTMLNHRVPERDLLCG